MKSKHSFFSIQSHLFLNQSEELQLLIGEDQLLAMLIFHRLESFFYPLIANSDNFSEHFKRNLQTQIEANKLYSLNLLHELIQITALFDDQQIDYISLKGPLLQDRLYGDWATHVSRDLDILVHFGELERVENLLLEKGYRRIDPVWKTKKQKFYIEKYKSQLTYYHEEKGITVEIHWNLFSGNLISPAFLESCWKRKKKLTFKSRTFNILGEEDECIYLCIHGLRHYWFRLFWLKDIEALLSKKNRDFWEKIQREAQVFKVEKYLLLTQTYQEALKAGQPQNNSDGMIAKMSQLKFEKLSISASSYSKMVRAYMVQMRITYLLHGLSGVFRTFKNKNFKPENWSFFVFSDCFFSLNFVFSRLIYFLKKISGQ